MTKFDALEVVRFLDQTSIDLINISGGTYFPGAKASSDSTGGGPYFLDFSRLEKAVTKVHLISTGGFKTLNQAVDAVASGAVDMVGLGCAMALNPRLANDCFGYNIYKAFSIPIAATSCELKPF